MSSKVAEQTAQKPRAAKPDYFVHPSACIDRPCSIGPGTKIGPFSHVMKNARIGQNCSIGQNVFVASSAVIGDGVTIQNNVSIHDGVVLEDGVFCGPSVSLAAPTGGLSRFSRSENGTVPLLSQSPRSENGTVPLPDEVQQTLIQRGAILGPNATILAGHTVGQYADVSAGAVVDADVLRHTVVAGVPAARVAWRCRCGNTPIGSGSCVVTSCAVCGRHYRIEPDGPIEYSPTEERASRKAHLKRNGKGSSSSRSNPAAVGRCVLLVAYRLLPTACCLPPTVC